MINDVLNGFPELGTFLETFAVNQGEARSIISD